MKIVSSGKIPENERHRHDLKELVERIYASKYDYIRIDQEDLKRWSNLKIAAACLNWAAKTYQIPIKVHVRNKNLYASKIKGDS